MPPVCVFPAGVESTLQGWRVHWTGVESTLCRGGEYTKIERLGAGPAKIERSGAGPAKIERQEAGADKIEKSGAGATKIERSGGPQL